MTEPTQSLVNRNNETAAMDLTNASTFIESQFPVAKVSAEAYKERKAGASQTLTGLGKWWGRKPLVLVRAILLGLLLPATGDPQKDRDVFLKLMTMDNEGLLRRKSKSIPQKQLIEDLLKMPPSTRDRFLEQVSDVWELKRLSREERRALQKLVFQRMPYSNKLRFCARPEQIDGPSPGAWEAINAHLDTDAHGLAELVAELGQRRFDHRPRVGDAFCGGGSVPFEAARLDCDAYGSDLNPVATLLTWAALNIIGGGEEVAQQVQKAQEAIFEAVDEQITTWHIEHNDRDWRADAFFYCTESTCPECGWLIPLIPNWVIAEKYNVVAERVPDPSHRCFFIEVNENVSSGRMVQAKKAGTVVNSRLNCPHCGVSTPMAVVRRHLRMWQSDDIVPRSDDIFQERLYAIRWVETYFERAVGRRRIELSQEEAEALPDFHQLLASRELKQKKRRHYSAPNALDHAREHQVLALLQERFHDWQEKGYIPSRRIESGAKTDEPIRTRGWTYWHHLFTPRQLLVHGLFLSTAWSLSSTTLLDAIWCLAVARCTDWNSKLNRVDPHRNNAKNIGEVFINQALNTLYNFAGAGFLQLRASATLRFTPYQTSLNNTKKVLPIDARDIDEICDYWITDPPYADAVNYHELSEFFLAWYERHLSRLFPGWYTDTKRALAIRGNDPITFRQSMVAAYRNLSEHMPDDGMQVVMFTHQDAAVWADLTMVLWAAGLRVTAAWTIATETDSAQKQGNYVQGTVILVCRKCSEEEPLFLDEIVPLVELEVRRQLDAMVALDDASDPNFGDADYQLAAYAAALRVLTAQPIEEINPEREILRPRAKGEPNEIEKLIKDAVKIACDHLIPRGIESYVWKTMSPMERFYLKGLEVESHGEYRNGVYQELARGFGATAYAELLADTGANETRLKTATEFERRMLSRGDFGGTLMRQALFAVYVAIKEENSRVGLNYLRTELPDYWRMREKIILLLEYLAMLRRVSNMPRWVQDAEMAEILATLVRNDHI